jgi:AcrR family transcriptional regulator
VSEETTASAPDGRRQRSERSRQAIIDAMLSLVEEGVLVPTAQQVSARAGVGIRSVFRHFSDMESLYATTDAYIRREHAGLFARGDREGTLEERLLHAVEQHAVAYETLGPVFLSTRAQLWRYDILREQYARTQRQIRRDLEKWLPELKSLAPEQREMVDAVASFETWNRLRDQQGLDRQAAIGLVNSLLKKIILPGLPDSPGQRARPTPPAGADSRTNTTHRPQ